MKNIFNNALLCKNCKNKTTIIIQFPPYNFSKRISSKSFSEKINFKERNFRKKQSLLEKYL
jgi:hypothetical protein